jgi:hypothetical protein
MKQEILTTFPSLWMPLCALALFMALFIGFAAYIYFIERESSITYKENIPFHDEENHS